METALAVGGESSLSHQQTQVSNQGGQGGQLSKEEVSVSKEKVKGRKEDLESKEKVEDLQVIATRVLAAFGLRPFRVFDGEIYHVGFAVAEKQILELNYDEEILDDFVSNCCKSPSTSSAHDGLSPLPEESHVLPTAAIEEEGQNQSMRENNCLSNIPNSPKEVLYIMEEFYLSPKHGGKGGHANPNPKEIYFIMEDQYFSPEELRVKICFPSHGYPPPPPKDAAIDTPVDVRMDQCHTPCEAGGLDDCNNGAKEAPTFSDAGKVKDDKVRRPKKKSVEEYDASQSVRLDKCSTLMKASKRASRKVRRLVSPEEPPMNALVLMDLEEQTGDSWVEGKLMALLEENPGDVVNPGQASKSFWPTPLYGSPGRQVKPGPPLPEKSNPSTNSAASEDEESSEVEDFEEFLEQSRKKEEVALAKYALLFKDDQSWRQKFLDGLNLTCDICFSKNSSTLAKSSLTYNTIPEPIMIIIGGSL